MIDRLLARGLIPDRAIRAGIRRLLRRRLRQEGAGGAAACQERQMAWVEELRASPIAIATAAANQQHYEVPAAFYQRVLGRHLKYSSGLWDAAAATDLDAAEAAMLALYVERAELRDGMRVLDLGCGWGSLSLWIAERFPACLVLGLSNSASQREFIEARARERGLDNLEIRTADINEFDTERRFDRVLSIEMFEHLRNYESLLRRIASWLAADGKLFVHIFTHREFAYPFETAASDDWMGRYFFTGGQMPSDRLLLYFQRDVAIERHWRVSGRHYGKTADAWLRNFDAARAELAPVLRAAYGDDARRMAVYWRVFFMACSELWHFRGGDEWFVSHYLFRRR